MLRNFTVCLSAALAVACTPPSTTEKVAIVGVCTPTTCALQGKNCGSIADGCNGTLDCGTCTAPLTCGANGTPNVCGMMTVACVPDNTAACAGKCSGTVTNNCGEQITCSNSCPTFQTCGGGGDPTVCGCTPDNLSACVGRCSGTATNNCGETVACSNACSAPQTCGGGGSPTQCGCTPDNTAACAGKCNVTATNNCGGSVLCPDNCVLPQTCGGGGSSGVCGCTPNNPCIGMVCGMATNSCNQMVSCGSCLPGATCSGNPGASCSEVCSLSSLGTVNAIPSINGAFTKVLGTITPDELTYVMTANNSVNHYVADRASAATGFATPVALAALPNAVNQRPIAMPDRLSFIYITTPGSGEALAKVTRASTSTTTYGAPSTTEFAQVNALLASPTGPTGFINSAAIAPDGLSLFISVYDGGQASPNFLATYEFTRATTAAVFTNPTLHFFGRTEFTVTGVSADRRTVFFDTFATSNAWAHTTRSSATGLLPSPTIVNEDFKRIVPNDDCTMLYGVTGSTPSFKAAQRTSN